MALFSLLLTLLSTLPHAHASTESDFYCAQYTLTAATYSELTIKGCKDGAKEIHGLCTQTVHCIFLNDTIKKDIEKLAEDEKTAYFKKKNNQDWVPSTLTCTGAKNSSGQGLCPMPDKCKGDMIYKTSVAVMNQTEYDEALKRFQTGEWKTFPVHYETDDKASKAK